MVKTLRISDSNPIRPALFYDHFFVKGTPTICGVIMLLFTPTCYQFLMVSDLVFFYFRSVFVIPCPPLCGFILVFFTPRGHPIGMGNNFETLHLRSVFASTKKNIFLIVLVFRRDCHPIGILS